MKFDCLACSTLPVEGKVYHLINNQFKCGTDISGAVKDPGTLIVTYTNYAASRKNFIYCKFEALLNVYLTYPFEPVSYSTVWHLNDKLYYVF